MYDITTSWMHCTFSKFERLEQILNYLQSAAPGRQISINLIEKDSISAPDSYTLEIADSDGNSLGSFNDRYTLWGHLYGRVRRTLELIGPRSDEVRAFSLYYLKPRDERMGCEEIAILLNKKPRTIRRYIGRVRDELELSFRRHGLLPDSNEYNSD